MPKRPPDCACVVVVAPPKRPPLCCGWEVPPPPNRPPPAGLLAAPPKSPPEAGAWELAAVEDCPNRPLPPDAGAWVLGCPKRPPAGACDVVVPLEYSRGGGSSDVLYIRDDMFAQSSRGREYQASNTRRPTPELRKQTSLRGSKRTVSSRRPYLSRGPRGRLLIARAPYWTLVGCWAADWNVVGVGGCRWICPPFGGRKVFWSRLLELGGRQGYLGLSPIAVWGRRSVRWVT